VLKSEPPKAKIRPHTLSMHGDIRIDNYYWLREKENPDVRAYLRDENAYTRAVMKETEPLQKELYDEMLARIKETDLSVPERIDTYYYYSRTEKGKQYSIYCRKKDVPDADEEVLLDVNDLAKDKPYLRVGVAEISPDHTLLAYSTDTDGSETYSLFVKNCITGAIVDTRIDGTHYSIEWMNDSLSFCYTLLNESKRPYRVYRHTLGTDPAGDELLYHEGDEGFFLWLGKTRSEKYIILTADSNNTTEVRFLDADVRDAHFRLFAARRRGIEYSLDHRKDRFYIVTNEEAKNFKLLSTPVDAIDPRHLVEEIPHREDCKLDGIDLFANHMVVYERTDGLKTIRVRSFENNDVHAISFPEPVYNVSPADNPEYKTDLLRFHYTSFITPMSVYDYNMNTRERELKKRTEVLGGYDPARYVSERIYATAADGTKVPISMVYRTTTRRDGTHPLLLYGYGAYGISQDVAFSSNRLSLLDRGFIFAIAHVRGGGEMGRQWYEDGKLFKKKNTFTDFIGCAEHLSTERYTSPENLVVYGGSAGGLLIGAVINMQPGLFCGAVANVPFVDVLTTMLDASIPLTVIEYDEWGNPNDQTVYEYMKSYSPYDNVTASAYPHLLVLAGLNDPRVQYWEPAKWTAKLRALKTDKNTLLLKTDMKAGHGGTSGRYDYLKDIAFEYAFILGVVNR
jgi:oligopeptidase B